MKGMSNRFAISSRVQSVRGASVIFLFSAKIEQDQIGFMGSRRQSLCVEKETKLVRAAPGHVPLTRGPHGTSATLHGRQRQGRSDGRCNLGMGRRAFERNGNGAL